MNFQEIQIWPPLAGLGLFLFGMYMLEEALKALVGRSFKKFLSKHTGNPIKAVISGASVTAILQSSSMVSLLVMSFAGAGIIGLNNGIGMIMGANLGTTMTGWLVSLIGFKLNIQAFILPFLAIGGLGIIFLKSEKLSNYSKLLMGFSFMFLGLDFMKSGFEGFANQFDLSFFADKHPAVFLLTGLVLTASIQSSSAAMMIFLSSLAAGFVSLNQAVFLVIGADLGTTVTSIIASINGNEIKRKVGMSQVLFNVITGLLAIVLMYPLLFVISDILKINDQLIALVTFHSLFNLTGIIVLLPFINIFVKILNRFVIINDSKQSVYVSLSNPLEAHAAIEALNKEVFIFIQSTIYLNSSFFGIENKFNSKKLSYNELKSYESELTDFYLTAQQVKLHEDEVNALNSLGTAIRNATLSVKDIKDIKHNLDVIKKTGNDDLFKIFKEIQLSQTKLYETVEDFLNNETLHFEERLKILMDLVNDSQLYEYENALKLREMMGRSEIDYPTLLNMINAINNSNQSLLRSLKHYWKVNNLEKDRLLNLE
jgi:phosphate:Na+ symporter